MVKSRKDWEAESYSENTGHAPETRFPDDPDWNYRGTKTEREELERRFGLTEEPIVIEGQEELFNA